MNGVLFFIQQDLTIAVISNVLADDVVFYHCVNQLECSGVSNPEVALDKGHAGQAMLQNKAECLLVEVGGARGLQVGRGL